MRRPQRSRSCPDDFWVARTDPLSVGAGGDYPTRASGDGSVFGHGQESGPFLRSLRT